MAFNSTTFTPEQDAFILMAHFRSGTRNEDGSWTYSLQSCIQQFIQEYPNLNNISHERFSSHRNALIKRFKDKHCICKGKSSGRRTVLTEEVMNNIKQRIDRSPTKSVASLSTATGLSVGTVHKALKKLRSKMSKVKA